MENKKRKDVYTAPEAVVIDMTDNTASTNILSNTLGFKGDPDWFNN